MHLCRLALRACFHTLRRMAHFRGDPTLDIVLPPRSQLAARMATDNEMVLLRMNAVASRKSRQPMTLVLTEAMATSSECPRVRIEDLDNLDNPTAVALPGGKGVRLGRTRSPDGVPRWPADGCKPASLQVPRQVTRSSTSATGQRARAPR